ncbi:MAG TPA: hypothetical protein VNO21_24940, partial [Polyangiaceae bacterium]|nr:hypothetical protein [Polyangiaceae bacterium]
MHNTLLGASLAIVLSAGCSSQDGAGSSELANHDGGFDGSSQQDPPESRLTPSNLPPGTCDGAGASDLRVPAGASLKFDSTLPCDALIAQGTGLPSLCVRKFANVTIAGNLTIDTNGTSNDAVAIVATTRFEVTGSVTALAGGDARGAGGNCTSGPAYESGAGAGHAATGAPGEATTGDPPDPVSGGKAYASAGTQLVAGATGGHGCNTPNNGYPSGAGGGRAGGALQLVSCGHFNLSGTLSGAGGAGEPGHPEKIYRDMNGPSYDGTGGGGGGSGGTLLIEAQSLTGGATLSAIGGAGGTGGSITLGFTDDSKTFAGGTGGAGGTRSHPPATGAYGDFPSYNGDQGHNGAGGGGGSAGQILINVPA